MELLRLKKRRTLAQRGHSLLQDKLERLISEFHKLIRAFQKILPEFERLHKEFLENFIILKIQTPSQILRKILENTNLLDIDIVYEYLFNLRLPKFSFAPQEIKYSVKDTPCQWDKVLSLRDSLLESLLEVLRIYVSLEMLSQEILKTRRRVNALEYILIPRIQGSISLIEAKLAELEREFVLRLARIKDLIAS